MYAWAQSWLSLSYAFQKFKSKPWFLRFAALTNFLTFIYVVISLLIRNPWTSKNMRVSLLLLLFWKKSFPSFYELAYIGYTAVDVLRIIYNLWCDFLLFLLVVLCDLDFILIGVYHLFLSPLFSCRSPGWLGNLQIQANGGYTINDKYS